RKEGGHQHTQPHYQRLTKLELRMFVQHLGRATQTVVDHELDASQHTGEEYIDEIEDSSGIHGAFFLSARFPACEELKPSSIVSRVATPHPLGADQSDRRAPARSRRRSQ